MKQVVAILRWLLNFASAALAAFTFLYFVISLCVLVFKVTGLVVDGPMFFELDTPSYASLLVFQAACLAILGACFAVRATIGKKDDFGFIRRFASENFKFVARKEPQPPHPPQA